MSGNMHWYKAYPADFFEATMGWPSDLKGAYRLLLDLIYMHDGRVADDAFYIAAHLGLSSKRKWTSIKNQLLERGKITLKDGYLTNHRAIIETISRKHRRDKSEITDAKPNKNKRIKNTDIDTDINPPNPPIQITITEAEKPKPPSPEKIAHDEAWAEYRSALNAAAGGAASRPQVDGRALIDVCRKLNLPPRKVLAALLAFYRSPAIAKQEEMYRPGFKSALYDERFAAFLDKPAEVKPSAPQYESPLEMNKRLEREAREKRERKAA